MTECQKCHGAAQSYLCRLCMTELRQQLLRLPTLIDHLRDTALGLTRMSNEQSRSLGFESRTPTFDDRASALITQIEDTIGGWARGTARTYGLMISPPVTWHRPWDAYTHTSTDFAMFLAANVERLAKDPDIGELCESLRGYVRRALVIVNRRTPDQFCGPCPASVSDHRHCVDRDGAPICSKAAHECATRLMARRGALEVICPSCGAVHRVERLVTHLLARADNFRGTISELHRVLRMLGEPVGLSTLYRWAEPKTSRRGSGRMNPAGYLREDNRRIAPTRHSDKDKPLYRVSDARKQREMKSEGSKGK